jgi:hypothetical protein
MSRALKWQVKAVYCMLLGLLLILAGIKCQDVNWEYQGAIRYTEPVCEQLEAEAYNSIEKGTAVLIKIK